MKLRLRYDAGDGKGTFSVVHWPYEDSPSYRKKKTFDETGEWSLHEIGGEAGAWVTLNFWDMPYSFGRQPLEKLMVGRDGDERVLFTETDPDNCPDVVLRRSE
ncbi:hypothetical protein [Streptomyces sp. I05A-00742]|uniref:hypothetical protein n=1 Tax=Streptomyces sp. I05A-00742 TaxID=2732853 RepID=UPI00148894A7|nr:hypothetical protein [Streptomyces sp. I05A-00742]